MARKASERIWTCGTRLPFHRVAHVTGIFAHWRGAAAARICRDSPEGAAISYGFRLSPRDHFSQPKCLAGRPPKITPDGLPGTSWRAPCPRSQSGMCTDLARASRARKTAARLQRPCACLSWRDGRNRPNGWQTSRSDGPSIRRHMKSSGGERTLSATEGKPRKGVFSGKRLAGEMNARDCPRDRAKRSR